jgi:hypothetical protein
MPKCLLSVPSFLEAEHKACAEYEGIRLSSRKISGRQEIIRLVRSMKSQWAAYLERLIYQVMPIKSPSLLT